MKVCIIAGDYAGSNDGIGRYKTTLINGIHTLDKNITIEVIPNLKKSSENNTTNKSFASKLPDRVKDIIRKSIHPFETEYNYFKKYQRDSSTYINLLKETDADIFHAISPSEALSATALSKRPLITTFHDLIPLVSENRFLLEKVYFTRYIKAAKKSDVILADSQKTKIDLIEMLSIPKNKIIVLYPGIDTTLFYPIKRKQNKIKTILYHGGLVRRKGVYETLYAFNDLLQKRQDIRLVFSGGGEEAQKLQSEVARLHLDRSVSFLGFVKEEDVIKNFHAADLFIYPSKYEGFGYTPLEAMASGVPVIASNSSSIPEVVGDAAVLIDPNNFKEISEKMNAVLSDPELQSTMIKKGLKNVKKFSQDICSKELLAIYKSVL